MLLNHFATVWGEGEDPSKAAENSAIKSTLIRIVLSSCDRNYSLQAYHKLVQTAEELLLDDIHSTPRGLLPLLHHPLVKGLFVLLSACWGP